MTVRSGRISTPPLTAATGTSSPSTLMIWRSPTGGRGAGHGEADAAPLHFRDGRLGARRQFLGLVDQGAVDIRHDEPDRPHWKILRITSPVRLPKAWDRGRS